MDNKISMKRLTDAEVCLISDFNLTIGIALWVLSSILNSEVLLFIGVGSLIVAYHTVRWNCYRRHR